MPRPSDTGLVVELPLDVKRKAIEALKPETELHKVLRELFLAMGASWCDINHGATEYGKDLVFDMPDAIGGTSVFAAVVKIGKLSGAASKGALREVEEQVTQAFSTDYSSELKKARVSIDQVVVVCTGRVSNSAKDFIVNGAHSRGFGKVTFWAGDRLLENLERHLPSFFLHLRPQERDYLVALRNLLSDLTKDFKRFGGSSSRLLGDVFVEPAMLMLEEPRPGRRLPRLGKTRHVPAASEQPSEAVFNTTAFEDPNGPNLLLMGGPGAGKSIALRKAACTLVERRLAGDASAPMPFMCNGVTLAKSISDGQVNAVLAAIRSPSGDVLSEEELEQTLTQTPCIFFVDALDELGTDADGEPVLRFLTTLADRFPSLRIICSSRRVHLRKAPGGEDFTRATILPWNARAMVSLLERLVGQEKMVSVLDSLISSGLDKALPTTPLVYTLLGILHEQNLLGEVPATAADLYDMLVDVCVGRWSSAENGLRLHSKRMELLKRLAVTMHNERTTSIDWERAHAIATAYFEPRGGTAEEAAEMLGWLLRNSQILVDGPDNSLMFGHLSFQEFLCAKTLEHDSSAALELAKHFTDSWWSNVLTFYVGLRGDTPDVIRRIVANEIPENWLGSLGTALTMGPLLQAAKDTPTEEVSAGIMWATGLIGDFYQALSDFTDLPMTRFQVMWGVASLFGAAYASVYLKQPLLGVLEPALQEFRECEDESRVLLGLRVLGISVALAERGEWSGIDRFLEVARKSDVALLQTAAQLLELSEPISPSLVPASHEQAQKKEVARWKRTVRTIRKLAPKDGATALARLGQKLTPTKGARQLIGRKKS